MITGNEPAYPLSPDGNKELGYNEGLTIRQHFTAMAMQGLLANVAIQENLSMTPSRVAEEAVIYADAIIFQLNNKTIKP